MHCHSAQLVRRPRKTLRRVANFTGLDWQESMLHAHTDRAPVHTASALAVRQPIHTRSLTAWRDFEPELREVLARGSWLPGLKDGFLPPPSSPPAPEAMFQLADDDGDGLLHGTEL